MARVRSMEMDSLRTFIVSRVSQRSPSPSFEGQGREERLTRASSWSPFLHQKATPYCSSVTYRGKKDTALLMGPGDWLSRALQTPPNTSCCLLLLHSCCSMAGMTTSFSSKFSSKPGSAHSDAMILDDAGTWRHPPARRPFEREQKTVFFATSQTKT